MARVAFALRIQQMRMRGTSITISLLPFFASARHASAADFRDSGAAAALPGRRYGVTPPR